MATNPVYPCPCKLPLLIAPALPKGTHGHKDDATNQAYYIYNNV